MYATTLVLIHVPCLLPIEDPTAICPNCRKRMSRKLNYIGPKGEKELAVAAKGGFVKEAVTYMVMDDLVVKPIYIRNI